MFARFLLIVALFAPAIASAVPKIEHWTLANGARVYFVEAHELPMVQVQAVFDAGAAREPSDKRGLARLASVMLREGTEKLNADQVAERFERLGAQFGADSERDMASVELRSLTDPALLDPAVELFAALLGKPAYPAASLERERARALIGLARDEQSPGTVAQKSFMRLMYGEHPYADNPSGTEESLKRITRDDLAAYHRRHYVGRNLWLAIVGNLTSAQAHRIADNLVGSLPAGEPLPPLPPIKPLDKAVINKVSFPASQTHILIGQPAITRTDPDYFPLIVGNHVLGGGGLVSRLSNEVREKRGLAYSVYSYFGPLRAPGPFVMGVQTKNASRDEAQRLLRKVLADFMASGPTESELAAVKSNIVGGFALRLDSNSKIADQLATIAFYGLPLTYLDDYPARVQAVTAAQIRDAFSRRLSPEKMVMVTVGGDR